jgi:hypothetical protein
VFLKWRTTVAAVRVLLLSPDLCRVNLRSSRSPSTPWPRIRCAAEVRPPQDFSGKTRFRIERSCSAAANVRPQPVALERLRGTRQTREVRHGETNCTGAQQSGRKQTEAASRKTTRNSEDRSRANPVNRSLDHGIGVRIPASQPLRTASPRLWLLGPVLGFARLNAFRRARHESRCY